MNTLTKTLLTGAAMSALAVAPALAAPSTHLANGSGWNAGKLTASHYKTGGGNHNPSNFSNYTVTFSFSGSLTRSVYRKHPVQLNAYTWFGGRPASGGNCAKPKKEKGIFKQTTAAAKIKNGSVTGSISSCTGTTYTFYGAIYDLTSKTATSDSFSGAVVAKLSGNHDTLNENWHFNIH